MISLCKIRDLEQYGIEYLTGESCALGLRGLYDVTEHGRQIIADAFGIPNIQLPDAWNCGTDDNPHVGSIMLTEKTLEQIAVFALFQGLDTKRSGYTELHHDYKVRAVLVWTTEKSGVFGFTHRDTEQTRQEFRMIIETMYHDKVERQFNTKYIDPDITNGFRNVHQMSQRFE